MKYSGLSVDKPADRPKKLKPETREGFRLKLSGPDGNPERLIKILKKNLSHNH